MALGLGTADLLGHCPLVLWKRDGSNVSSLTTLVSVEEMLCYNCTQLQSSRPSYCLPSSRNCLAYWRERQCAELQTKWLAKKNNVTMGKICEWNKGKIMWYRPQVRISLSCNLGKISVESISIRNTSALWVSGNYLLYWIWIKDSLIEMCHLPCLICHIFWLILLNFPCKIPRIAKYQIENLWRVTKHVS